MIADFPADMLLLLALGVVCCSALLALGWEILVILFQDSSVNEIDEEND